MMCVTQIAHLKRTLMCLLPVFLAFNVDSKLINWLAQLILRTLVFNHSFLKSPSH